MYIGQVGGTGFTRVGGGGRANVRPRVLAVEAGDGTVRVDEVGEADRSYEFGPHEALAIAHLLRAAARRALAEARGRAG